MLHSHDKKQVKKLRSYLGRYKQMLQAELESLQAELDHKMHIVYASPEHLHEKRKREIPEIIEKEIPETIELIDQLMSRIGSIEVSTK